MENSPQYLFLASGVNNGEGFWIVGIKNCDEIILEDENLLDCHRKELVGNKSAKDILLAINSFLWQSKIFSSSRIFSSQFFIPTIQNPSPLFTPLARNRY